MAKLRVLTIEDDVNFIDLINNRIESWGYESILAYTGREGIEAVKSKDPNMIILDYMMPEMDGVTTLKEIRKINKDIPVIMFTAYPDVKVIKGTEKLGVTAFIPKLSAYSNVLVSLKSAINMIEKKLEGK